MKSSEALPSTDKGVFYMDGAALHPVLLITWVVMMSISALFLLGVILAGVIGPWTDGVKIAAFIILLIFLLIFTLIFLVFFGWWFFKYTKKKVEFNEKYALITTTFGLFPCYSSQIQCELEQINAFLIRPTLITNCLPDNLKRFTVSIQTLGRQEFVLAAANNIYHQKKLVSLFKAQPGLTNLGEVERIMTENFKNRKMARTNEKKREKILKEREKKREERLKQLEEKKKNSKVDDMDDEDRQKAMQNWRRLRDHKRLRSKYGGILS